MYYKASTSLRSRNSHARKENEEIPMDEPFNIPPEIRQISLTYRKPKLFDLCEMGLVSEIYFFLICYSQQLNIM